MIRIQGLAPAGILVAVGLLVGSCTAGGGGAGGQTWTMTFQDPGGGGQQLEILVSEFTHSGTWSETSDSPGLWMTDPSGQCRYQLTVGGNVFHDSPGDRFSCVNLGGAGCGMQTLGSCELTANGNYPNATAANGTYTLTTETQGGDRVTANGTVVAQSQ